MLIKSVNPTYILILDLRHLLSKGITSSTIRGNDATASPNVNLRHNADRSTLGQLNRHASSSIRNRTTAKTATRQKKEPQRPLRAALSVPT